MSFTDPNTGSTGYIVTYSDGVTTSTVSPNPTGTSVSLTGLTANTSYTVSVQALCASGDTSSVVSASLTTPCEHSVFHLVKTLKALRVFHHVGQSLMVVARMHGLFIAYRPTHKVARMARDCIQMVIVVITTII